MNDLSTISRYQVFKNRKRILKNPLPFHHGNFEKFGDIFRVKIGFGKTIVFTRNPKLIIYFKEDIRNTINHLYKQ